MSCGLLQLRLVRSYFWLEFRRLDTRCSWFYPTFHSSSSSWIRVCGWFYPTSGSSSAGWIQVAVDSILRLTRVSAAEYELRLIVSCGWLEFRRLETSCGWFHHTADSSSAGWIGVVADSITRLTRVPAARYELRLIPSYCYFEFRWLDTSYSWFHPAAGYELQLFYLVADSRSAGWIRHAADIYFNISSNFKDWFCKRHHFYNLFSICWFQLPLIQALPAASRTLKKLEETGGSLKKLQDSSCYWFELQRLIRAATADSRPATNRLPPEFWPRSRLINILHYLLNFAPVHSPLIFENRELWPKKFTRFSTSKWQYLPHMHNLALFI